MLADGLADGVGDLLGLLLDVCGVLDARGGKGGGGINGNAHL